MRGSKLSRNAFTFSNEERKQAFSDWNQGMKICMLDATIEIMLKPTWKSAVRRERFFTHILLVV